MNVKKSLLRRLLPWLISAALLAALIIFVFVPIYSQEDAADAPKPIVHSYMGDGKAMTMENDDLLFTLDPATTQFTLLQKSTGHLWRSNPEDVEGDPIALKVDKDKLKSTLILTYSTSDGTNNVFNNYAYSVENGVYDVTQNEDGSIEVDYTVGKVSKVFYIPLAVPEARMDELIGTLSKSDKRKVTDSYRLYNPDKLKASDDAAALKAMYPALNEGKMYILRDGVADHVKKKLSGYFEGVGYTADDYYKDLEYIAGESEVSTAVFNVTLRYRLEGGDLVVDMPYEKMRYLREFPVINIALLPNFGAAYTDEDGYILVPDGGGAQISYNNGKLSQNTYYANMYGWDWAQERKQAVNETRCSFPMFAMTGGGSSFLCLMEGNNSYGGIQADISGRLNSYNTCYAKYTVLHSDQYDVSAKNNNRVFMYEEQIAPGSATHRYRFLPTDDYVQMAMSYRDYLKATYPALGGDVHSELPVTVELLGAIDKTLQRMGLPQQVAVPMTSFEQAGGIMDDLLSAGAKNLKLIYAGWVNGGVAQNVLTKVNVVRELGGEKGLTALASDAKSKGVELYIDGAVEFAYDSDLFDGFIAFRDAAKYTTRDKVLLYPYSSIWYTPMMWRDVNYLVKPKYMVDCANNLISAAQKLGVTGVAYRDVGSVLSADYNPRELVTREAAKSVQQGILADTAKQGLKTATKLGNDYALSNTNLVLDMDLVGGAYSILDASIPFYQIALHGLVEYTGPAINISGDYMLQFLKAVEYGAGLNFSMMSEQSKVLQDSFYSGYYASCYDLWGKKAADLIASYQKDMAGLGDKRIIGHERLTNDVAVTTYETGARVYVNYGDKPYTASGVNVPARGYAVKGGN